MGRPSTIDRLPEEVRVEIGRLRGNGRTIDEIMAHLKKLDGIAPVSRSALGRHVEGLAKMGDQIRQTQGIVEAFKAGMGDAGESEAARVAIHIATSNILKIMLDADIDDTKKMEQISNSLSQLSRASKTNVEFLAVTEKRAADRAKREAVEQVETIGREKGISAATLNAIKAGIFGIKPEAVAP